MLGSNLNVGEIINLNLIEQVGFDEFWNNSVPFGVDHKHYGMIDVRCS